MKKLIKLNEYFYIIDDSDIKDGDWFYNKATNYIGRTIRKEGNFWVCVDIEGFHLLSEAKKIIYSSQKLEVVIEIDFLVVENIVDGHSSLNLATTFVKDKCRSFHAPGLLVGYIEGFKTHKELVKDRLFTEADIRKALSKGIELARMFGNQQIEEKENFIKSLLPPTEWDIEIDENNVMTKSTLV